MPTNADQRRAEPINADRFPAAITDALPVLMRRLVMDAVERAQASAGGGPVTSQQARSATQRPVLRHARAFTALAIGVSRLGPDERGRVLHAAGTDRKGFALWWVEERRTEEPDGSEA